MRLGQTFARLGSRVTLVEMADRLLAREDPRASELIASRLTDDGVDVRTGRRAREVRAASECSGELVLDGADGPEPIRFDRILVATGRSPRTDGLGLDTVGVRVNDRGAIVVDDRVRTTARGIYGAGDVTGLLPFTHVAAHHSRVLRTGTGASSPNPTTFAWIATGPGALARRHPSLPGSALARLETQIVT